MFERIKKFLGGRDARVTPAPAGETEGRMSDPITTPTTPGASGGLTEEQLQKALTNAIAAATKPLQDQIAALQGELRETDKNLKTVAETVAGQKVLGEDQVRALVTAEADTRAAQAVKAAEAKQAADAIKSKREAFAAEHLKNVPKR